VRVPWCAVQVRPVPCTGGGWKWIATLLASFLGWVTVALGQPPCGTPECDSGWVYEWVPGTPPDTVGERLQDTLYPDCRVWAQIWARCCNGVLEIVVDTVWLSEECEGLVQRLGEGDDAAYNSVMLTIIVAAAGKLSFDSCVRNGIAGCEGAGGYFFRMWNAVCRAVWYCRIIEQMVLKSGGEIAIPGRWYTIVRCSDGCCREEWIVCRRRPPCERQPGQRQPDPCLYYARIGVSSTGARCSSPPLPWGCQVVSPCQYVCPAAPPPDRGMRIPGTIGPCDRVRVYDVLGRKVYEGNCQGLSERLPRGIYCIEDVETGTRTVRGVW